MDQSDACPTPGQQGAAGPPEEATALNHRLVERYTEIARLVGGLAHEIKNPLSTIRLNMELLAEEFAASQSPRDKRALNKILVVERECQRLQDLLDHFLDFAKVRHLRFQIVDLNQEIERLLDFFAPQAKDAKIEIVKYLDPNLPPVRIDPEAFRGALLNLVLNAQQAMPGGGQLVARTKRSDGQVTLDLIDTGAGMDAKTLAHIFDAFYSTKPGGTGLGLPTARKIIEAHGGTIGVESEPGKGTKFCIALPAIPPAPKP
jgi:signal transduction histidine kinase